MRVFRLFTLFVVAFVGNALTDEPGRILVQNRILTKVHGKTISVIDVMKRMNLIINHHFPEIVNSSIDRYEFYTAQWKQTLSQMVDEQLIIADAENIEVKISDGDIRERLQDRFGPNVAFNLEKIGLSYDEAKEAMRSELIVQKMTWYRINAKAILSINPQDVKGAYKEYCSSNPPKDEWKYQALSIRSSNEDVSRALSEEASQLLKQGRAGLAAVAEALKQKEGLPEDLSISVSQDYAVDQKNLSESHKNVLLSLQPDSYSEPLKQSSRVNHESVHRIFHLKDHVQEKTPSFGELSDKIEDRLIQQAISKESALYISKLRKRFGYDEKNTEVLPEDFHPFVLLR
jgi:hypothetical protein